MRAHRQGARGERPTRADRSILVRGPQKRRRQNSVLEVHRRSGERDGVSLDKPRSVRRRRYRHYRQDIAAQDRQGELVRLAVVLVGIRTVIHPPVHDPEVHLVRGHTSRRICQSRGLTRTRRRNVERAQQHSRSREMESRGGRLADEIEMTEV